MSEKPEALRLADDLDVASLGIRHCLEALSAAALRRLHADNERLREELREARELAWSYGADDLHDRINETLQEPPR